MPSFVSFPMRSFHLNRVSCSLSLRLSTIRKLSCCSSRSGWFTWVGSLMLEQLLIMQNASSKKCRKKVCDTFCMPLFNSTNLKQEENLQRVKKSQVWNMSQNCYVRDVRCLLTLSVESIRKLKKWYLNIKFFRLFSFKLRDWPWKCFYQNRSQLESQLES